MNGDVELRRSCRNRKPPERYGNPVDLEVILSSDDGIMDAMGYHKIKRILGQKCLGNKKLYLVHLVGQPAEHAVCVTFSSLNGKAKRSVQIKPPPVIVQIE